jgi:hypothetical protein
MGKPLELTGERYEYFIVKERLANDNNSGTQWRCVCNCGKEFVDTGSRIKANKRKSCGCQSGNVKQHGNQKQHPSQTTRKSYLNSYKQRCKRDKLSWDLTDEFFYSLIEQDCHYCGVSPLNPINVYMTKAGKARSKNLDTVNGGWVKVNGVDRTDSSIGYRPDNVVTCCKICNYAKQQLSMEEFLGWLEQIRSNGRKS